MPLLFSRALTRARKSFSTQTPSRIYASQNYHRMGKNKSKRQAVPSEDHLLLPKHSAHNLASIIDTHTHVAYTFELYGRKYKDGRFKSAFDFFRGVCEGRKVEAVVDVWCEAPVRKSLWRTMADSALSEEDREKNWGGTAYHFVMGVHPHEAKSYTDDVEKDIMEAMNHPRCVGWGEMGLDYHYDNSPRDVQQNVFARQLKLAVLLGKPLTIHTREAEEDTERILKAEVPKEQKIHIHCFTGTPGFAAKLLDHFPNLYIGITGVITYSTNDDTASTVREMVSRPEPLRILLETDAPYMVPSNLYDSLPEVKGKLPLCHTSMIPWTAEFVANTVGEGWDTEKVLLVARENARKVYGI